jgi:hypothetical protein
VPISGDVDGGTIEEEEEGIAEADEAGESGGGLADVVGLCGAAGVVSSIVYPPKKTSLGF